MKESSLGKNDFMFSMSTDSRQLVYQREEEVTLTHFCCFYLAGCAQGEEKDQEENCYYKR